MRTKKSNVWILTVGIALLWLMAGCSSQLETTILSEKAPPAPEVTEVVEEQPVRPPEPVVSESKVAEEDMETPPAAAPPVVEEPPKDIPVEEPATPVIRPSSPEKAVATPPAKPQKAVEPPPAAAPVVAGGIPPILFDPESPPQPTIRKGSPEEVAMLEPEPVKVPEKEKVAPPASSESSRMVPGIPPSGFEPELPPDPTLREGGPAPVKEPEQKVVIPPQKPVEEKPLEVAKVQPQSPPVPVKNLADVYFEYDRFSLRDKDKNILNENAQIIINNMSGRKVVIEGHCDERGTESYNMILGKRRAEAVKEFLVDLGVPEENLEVVSYGKERPFCTDHSLQCWQENRRGHFVLR